MCEACGFPSPFVHLRVVLIFFGCRTPQGALSPGGDPPQGKNTTGIPNFTFVSLRIRTLRGIRQSPSFTGEKMETQKRCELSRAHRWLETGPG